MKQKGHRVNVRCAADLAKRELAEDHDDPGSGAHACGLNVAAAISAIMGTRGCAFCKSPLPLFVPAEYPLPKILLPFALLLACTCLPASAQYGERLPIPVARALKAAAIPTSAVAVVVQEVSVHLPRVSVNAAKAMNPASVMKLLTTYAALETLGPAYTWKTEAWIAGGLKDGRLDGDLYLKGGGDPKLSFAQFWLLLRNLRARGLRDIHGDLVLDRSLFAASATADFDDQPLRPYNVKPDALLLNFKAIRLQLIPQQNDVVVIAEPLPDSLELVNRIKPGNNGCGEWQEGLRSEISWQGQRALLTLSGSYPTSCGEKTWNLGVLSHPEYVQGVFRQLWRELGGTISGGLRDAAVPETARLIASSESPPLSEVVRDINKYSNNVMARQLFLTLGGESGHGGATAADADLVVRAWLAQKALRFPELVLENGSGLSRQERISAESLAGLLETAWRSPLMPEFIASLPLAAIDGTMRKRLKLNGVAGQAHIKTGTLDGVKAIAGYVHDRAGKWQIVVFLVNHANAAAAQGAQDALLQWVYQRGA